MGSSGFATTLVGAISVAIFLYLWVRSKHDPISSLPGTRLSRWTNIESLVQLIRGKQPQYVHSLFKKYGPVVRVGPKEICFCDLSAFKQIYNTKETFVKSPLYETITDSPAPSIFSTADVELHRRHRRLLAPGLSETSVTQMCPSVHSKVALTIQRMREETEARGAADIYKWWTFMTSEITGELTFGQSFRILEEGKKDEFTSDLGNGGAVLAALRLTLPFIIKIAEHVPLGIVTQACIARKQTFKRADEMLTNHRQAVMADADHPQQSFFTKLFQAESEEKLNWQEVRSNALTFLVAGTDTTANTLTYLTWIICQNPVVKATLLEELSRLPESFDDAQLKSLKYLNQVIEETLRLYPAVATGLLRVVPPEGANIAGRQIPRGSTVSCQAYSLQRDPDIFPRPDEFDPTRWESPTYEMRHAMMVWGGGARGE
ncbi:cytochrome P450 [Diaporthe amygdali]|uniref:cytochrome P450 n=1 Tax=Phomopsis amygdali TaxID=1214568 RepID=UPI0022FF399A|nr:cytochrome P450 [Diaporthe amygdali]KAJ0119841.1 cytochrome P450 [Diaporthe amygdali]